jgi:hypothetical protein
MKNILVVVLLFLILIFSMAMSQTDVISKITERSKQQVVLEVTWVNEGDVPAKINPYYSKGYRVVGITSYIHSGSDSHSDVVIIMEK